ncbi:MAG TPA: hypothetical protein QGF02_02720 [Candidatus Babeliales bacterium]|nr:hypothetical protein [Candidatus Babeliales bacterium]
MKKLVVLIGFLGLVGSAVGMESNIDLVTAAGDNDLGAVNKLIDAGVDLRAYPKIPTALKT